MNTRTPLLTASAVALGLGSIASAVTITALTNTGTLVSFDSATPGSILNTVTLSGITGGDAVVGIDYRPADGLLIGLGYNTVTGTARVYSITAAGVATSINSNTLTLGTGLARVTADFNPTANAIRIVTSALTANDLRITTAGTGAQANDTDLNPANPGIRSTAYSRNNAGGGISGATTLYEIDGTNNALVTQGSIDFFTGSGTSPNTGTLTSVATLTGVTGSAIVGFDIFSAPGTAASSPGTAFVATSTNLSTLNLTTGAATPNGVIGSGLTIVDIATVPEPGSIALCGLAAVVFAGRRRRTA